VQAAPDVLYIRRGFLDRLVVVVGRAPEAGEHPSAHPEACGDVRVIGQE
jgi:hypothetical protein